MYSHLAISDILNSIIPISRFNRGEANKIFEEVGSSGCKIVVKNNKPTCVLLAPERYEEMVEALSDYMLFLEAEKRLDGPGSNETIPHKALLADLGISGTELNDIEVDIE